jgi:hypothetical protein
VRDVRRDRCGGVCELQRGGRERSGGAAAKAGQCVGEWWVGQVVRWVGGRGLCVSQVVGGGWMRDAWAPPLIRSLSTPAESHLQTKCPSVSHVSLVSWLSCIFHNTIFPFPLCVARQSDEHECQRAGDGVGGDGGRFAGSKLREPKGSKSAFAHSELKLLFRDTRYDRKKVNYFSCPCAAERMHSAWW